MILLIACKNRKYFETIATFLGTQVYLSKCSSWKLFFKQSHNYKVHCLMVYKIISLKIMLLGLQMLLCGSDHSKQFTDINGKDSVLSSTYLVNYVG